MTRLPTNAERDGLDTEGGLGAVSGSREPSRAVSALTGFDPGDLLDLAGRCETADGPDRELDAQLGRYAVSEFLRYVPTEPQHGCRQYTASLDWALSLAPQGYHWQVGNGVETEFGNRDSFYAWCDDADTGELSFASTAPLALCAAALRARAAQVQA